MLNNKDTYEEVRKIKNKIKELENLCENSDPIFVDSHQGIIRRLKGDSAYLLSQLYKKAI
jgi:hypothetical protein